MTELPAGWAKASIGDVLRVEYGKGLPERVRSASGAVPVLASSGRVGTHSVALVDGPVLVIGRKGAVGAVHLSIEPCWPIDTAYYVRVPPLLSPWFLSYQLQWLDLRRLDSSTAVPSLRREDLESQLLRIPPLSEQERIVAAIEEQFSLLDSATAALGRARKNLHRMHAAALRRVFAEIEDASDVVAGADLFSFVTSGSRGWAAYYSAEGPLFLRIGNVPRRGVDLDLSDVQHVRLPEKAEGTRTRVQAGDILISITADLGRVAVIPPALPEAFINQHVALARPHCDVLPRYVAWYLASPLGLQQWQALQRGATKIGLGLDDIRAIRVSVPRLDIQQRIVERIDNVWDELGRTEAVIESASGRSRPLRSSILTAAFSGKLVPRDPNDEPASVLLERIAAERAASSNGKRPAHKPRAQRSLWETPA